MNNSEIKNIIMTRPFDGETVYDTEETLDPEIVAGLQAQARAAFS